MKRVLTRTECAWPTPTEGRREASQGAQRRTLQEKAWLSSPGPQHGGEKPRVSQQQPRLAARRRPAAKVLRRLVAQARASSCSPPAPGRARRGSATRSSGAPACERGQSAEKRRREPARSDRPPASRRTLRGRSRGGSHHAPQPVGGLAGSTLQYSRKSSTRTAVVALPQRSARRACQDDDTGACRLRPACALASLGSLPSCRLQLLLTRPRLAAQEQPQAPRPRQRGARCVALSPLRRAAAHVVAQAALASTESTREAAETPAASTTTGAAPCRRAPPLVAAWRRSCGAAARGRSRQQWLCSLPSCLLCSAPPVVVRRGGFLWLLVAWQPQEAA